MDRILVAASLAAYPKLRAALEGVQADYTITYAGGVEALLRNEYPLILVDLLFAESHMVEFAHFVKEQQPGARVACVNVTGYPLNAAARSRTEESLYGLGYDGMIELARVWEGYERRRRGSERRTQRRAPADRRHAAPLAP